MSDLFLQVEGKLFPEFGETLMLHSVSPNESLVTDIMDRAREIFQRNTVGPQRSAIIRRALFSSRKASN